MTERPGDHDSRTSPGWTAPAAPPTEPPPADPGQDWPAPGGWSGGWQQPAQPPPPGRNGMAVAALVLGIVPVFAGLLGLVFGLIGRSQARRTGQRGATMATVGACLGAAWLLGLGGLVAYAALNEAERDETGAVVAEGDESTLELSVGDCLSTLEESADVATVPLVPCTEPHDGEVYDSFALPDGEFPGDEAVAVAAESGCTERFEAFVGVPYADSVLEVFYYHPTRRSWTLADDREVLCVILSDGTTGSARGGAA